LSENEKFFQLQELAVEMNTGFILKIFLLFACTAHQNELKTEKKTAGGASITCEEIKSWI